MDQHIPMTISIEYTVMYVCIPPLVHDVQILETLLVTHSHLEGSLADHLHDPTEWNQTKRDVR